jgi:hypothetical protein
MPAPSFQAMTLKTGLAYMALTPTFIPIAIGAPIGVRPPDAGIASGMISTNQQIGGAALRQASRSPAWSPARPPRWVRCAQFPADAGRPGTG